MKKQTIREKIGAELKRRRKEKKITQEKLAELTGIGRTAIAKYELGTIELGLSHFSILCDELDGLRLELKQTENKIRNVSAAIATGVITKTLPEMLAELEKQREQIETAIVKKSAGVHEFSRDAVVAYLRELKALSHKDAGSQRHLINACIKSIYVFDTDDPDSLRLVINMNYFDNDAEINHEEIVRIVSSPLHFAVTSRTTVHGRRLLLVRTIKKAPG